MAAIPAAFVLPSLSSTNDYSLAWLIVLFFVLAWALILCLYMIYLLVTDETGQPVHPYEHWDEPHRSHTIDSGLGRAEVAADVTPRGACEQNRGSRKLEDFRRVTEEPEHADDLNVIPR